MKIKILTILSSLLLLVSCGTIDNTNNKKNINISDNNINNINNIVNKTIVFMNTDKYFNKDTKNVMKLFVKDFKRNEKNQTIKINIEAKYNSKLYEDFLFDSFSYIIKEEKMIIDNSNGVPIITNKNCNNPSFKIDKKTNITNKICKTEIIVNEDIKNTIFIKAEIKDKQTGEKQMSTLGIAIIDLK